MNYISFIQNLSKKETDASSLKREKLLAKIIEIIKNPPSPFGYSHDLKCTIEEYGITLEEFFFKICVTYLSKPVRTKEETYIIYSYLFFMNDLTSLIKKQDEGHYNEYLQIIANHMGYEKLEKNKILMRFGDKGRKAYIILDGTVDILIKSPKKVKLRDREYLYYIATLIKYKEYGLVNLVVNENFSVFPMYIEDDTLVVKGNTNTNSKVLPEWAIKEDSDDEDEKEDNETKRKDTRRGTLTNKQKTQMLNNIPQSFFHLNTKNESFRDSKNTLNIKVSQLLNLLPKDNTTNKTYTRSNSLTSNKSNHNQNNNSSSAATPNSNILNIITSTIKRERDILNTATVSEYISRFDTPPSLPPPSSAPPNLHTIYDLTIYTYIKIISRSTGALFGEVALSDPLALRTATIITSTDCHFATLNKRSYNLSLKSGADKQLRQALQFISSIKVFSDISISTLNKKYFNNFSLTKVTKGSIIMQQGEKSTCLSLLREGVYEVSMFVSLRELAKVVKYIYGKMHAKGGCIAMVEKSERECERLMKENLKFAKYYTTKELIRVSEIQCPDIVGLDDYVDDKKEMMFTIECKSPKGEMFRLSNHFYNEISYKDYTVKENEVEFLSKKYELHVKRLNTIRECKIESFFDYKSKKDIIQSKLKKDLESDIIRNRNMKRKVENIKTVINFSAQPLHNNDIKDNNNNAQPENILAYERKPHKDNSFRKTTFVKKLTQLPKVINDNTNIQNNTSNTNANKTDDRVIKGRNTKEMFTNTLLNSANIDKYVTTMPNLKSRKVINISNDIEYFMDDDDKSESNKMVMFKNYNTDIPPLIKNRRCITTNEGAPCKINRNLITTNKLLLHLNSKVWMNDMIWENVKPNLDVQKIINKSEGKLLSTTRKSRKHVLNLTERGTAFIKTHNKNKTIVDGEEYFDNKRKKYSEERNKNYSKTTKRINLIFGKK